MLLVAAAGRRFADGGLRALVQAGLLLGIGFGGFVDGIVLHQILQWHGMVSSALTPADLIAAKVNMFWDGIFHAGMWAFAGAGVLLLWRATRRAPLAGEGRRLAAAAVLGWALFNGIEGVIDHHLLDLHHVRDFVSRRLPWDLGFLAVSLVLGALSAPLALRRPRGA